METNRFQRWLTKKNQQHQDKATNPESELEFGSALSTEANLDICIGEECVDDVVDTDALPLDAETISAEILPVVEESNEKVSAQPLSNLGSPTSTLAHVFEQGFAKGDKKKQLRDLFLGGDFSDIDPLDSYNLDYSAVKSLSQEVASTLRHWHQRIDDALEEDDLANDPLIEQGVNEPLTGDVVNGDLDIEPNAEKILKSADDMELPVHVQSLTDELEQNSNGDTKVIGESVIDNSNNKPTKLPIND